MRVHTNPINPNARLDALYSAERAAAKREAARTRRKLSEFASKLAGEAEGAQASVVRLQEGEDSQAEADEQSRGKKLTKGAGEEDADNSISSWA